jgi:hypothetical protein
MTEDRYQKSEDRDQNTARRQIKAVIYLSSVL